MIKESKVLEYFTQFQESGSDGANYDIIIQKPGRLHELF